VSSGHAAFGGSRRGADSAESGAWSSAKNKNGFANPLFYQHFYNHRAASRIVADRARHSQVSGLGDVGKSVADLSPCLRNYLQATHRPMASSRRSLAQATRRQLAAPGVLL